MSLEVKSVRYDIIGDQAEVVLTKSVAGHSWVVQASFPLRLAGHDQSVPNQQRVIEEAERIFLEAAGRCERS